MDLSNITNLRAKYGNYKIGYKLSERKEFSKVRNFLSIFGMSTKNFDKNLESLIIEENKNTGSAFDVKRNQINNSGNENDLIHELFHMASFNKDNNTFGSVSLNNHFGESLNEGITDLFTYLVDEKYEVKYPMEVYVTSVLNDFYGNEFIDFHFKGDTKGLYESFIDDKEDVIDIVSNLDEYTKNNIVLMDCLYNFGSGNIDKNTYNPDLLCDSLVDSVSGLLRLINEYDSEKALGYYNLFRMEFNCKSDAIESLKSIISTSSYNSYSELLNYIKEEVFEMDKTL